MSGISTAACESGVLFIHRVKYTVVRDSWASARDISVVNSSFFSERLYSYFEHTHFCLCDTFYGQNF